MIKEVNYSKLSDAELAEKTKAKDYFAFFEIEQRYKKCVYWHVLKIVHDIVDAEDITMRTLDAARHNFETGQYKEEGKLLNWLFRIARYILIEDRRKKGIHFNIPLADALNVSFGQEELSGEINHIGKALHECGKKQRLAFILYLVKKWDIERIAKRLDIKARSVQTNAYKGRDFVLRFLSSHYHVRIKKMSFH